MSPTGHRSSAVARSVLRPVPRVVTRTVRVAAVGVTMALLGAVAAPIAAWATPAPVRPLPAPLVSTTLPARLAVGGPVVSVPFVVSFESREQQSWVMVGLTDVRGTEFATTTDGQTRIDGRLDLLTSDIGTYGPTAWRLTRKGGLGGPGIDDLPVRVGLRSLLAEKVTRSGDHVRVVGALKGYDIGSNSYPARPSRPVAVQRWSSTGWLTVAAVSTDRLGHLDRTIDIPWRVGIRLLTQDTTRRLGEATAGSIV